MNIFILLVLLGTSLQESQALKIASFNIQRFDESKANNAEIMNVLTTILQRYQLVAVQEIMDSDNAAVKHLVHQLNQESGCHYNFILSDHLGRSNYREKYAFVYNEELLQPLDWYHYDDGCEECGTDSFIREPFIVKFSSPSTVLKELVLVVIHTSPDYAVQEVDSLFDVWTDAKQHFNTEDVIILGDFNADCSFLPVSKWPLVRLRQSKALSWLIVDSEDTTVSANTHCAYDRIVASGTVPDTIIPGSASAFNYQKALGLLYDKARDVSDHYPVEVEVKDDAAWDGMVFEPSSSLGIEGGQSGMPCDCVGVDLTTCKGRCGAYNHSLPCHCNASCSKYSSCCADYKEFCQD
ncbi:deoxyribonuclease-1-like [Polypterus senegalus]|uniref:deoxyribonuclease-1-like n=1 Tax=Polypterus senegalus TaxID=55291 RepID=UPI0019642B78|nr:deoxyribonuclease-1-like [Polypterus senegalus]